jgi:hypothetical protein
VVLHQLGVYAVSVSPQPSAGRGIEPATVRVIGLRHYKRNFRIDTGIR